jgi:hypothetical protein
VRLSDLSKANHDVLDCRSMGHAWKHVTDHDWVRSGGEIITFWRTESCMRCGTERERCIDLEQMAVTKRRMHYADNYLMVPGHKRVHRIDALRAMYKPSKKHTKESE